MPRLFDPDGGEVRFGAWKVTPYRAEINPTGYGWTSGLIGYCFDVSFVEFVRRAHVGRKGLWLCRGCGVPNYDDCVWTVLFVGCDEFEQAASVRTNGPPMDFSGYAEHIDRIAEWEATVMADPAAAPAYADWLEENGVAPWRMHRLRGTVGVKS